MKRYFGLQGCSTAWQIDKLSRASKRLLVICDDANSLETLTAELKFFAADKKLVSLKGWENIPYEHLSPPIDISAARISSLFQIYENDWDIILTSVESLTQKIIPYNLLTPLVFEIKEGKEISRDKIIENLSYGGYRRVSIVEEIGDYAVRGSVVDFFPINTKSPIRIELFDDEIERLRLFNPESQRSIASINEFKILPVSEYIDLLAPSYSRELLEEGILNLKRRSASLEVPLRESARIIDAFKSGRRLPGLETIQAELLPALNSLLNTLAPDTEIVLNNKVSVLRAMDSRWELICAREDKAKQNHELAPNKNKLFISPDNLSAELTKFDQIHFESLQLFDEDNAILTEKIRALSIKDLGVKIRSRAGSGNAFEPLSQKLHEWRDKKYKVIFHCRF